MVQISPSSSLLSFPVSGDGSASTSHLTDCPLCRHFSSALSRQQAPRLRAPIPSRNRKTSLPALPAREADRMAQPEDTEVGPYLPCAMLAGRARRFCGLLRPELATSNSATVTRLLRLQCSSSIKSNSNTSTVLKPR